MIFYPIINKKLDAMNIAEKIMQKSIRENGF